MTGLPWALVSLAGPTDGVSPQAISLPSGPGSIEGLGESFEPQLNTGTATFTVALEVPPGRAGVQPTLALAYNGGSGNGLLGIGWSVSGLDAIHRQTDKGLPRYDETPGFTGSDTFVTMGGEELVPLADGSYRAENEGAFRRYSYDLATNEWLCEEPDGSKRRFGEAASARVEDAGRTFAWYLTSHEDTHGNRIEYGYRSFADSPNQVYPAEIRYTRHATQTLAGEHVVVFTYEDATRPDRVRDYRPGFEQTIGRRLTRIDACTLGGSFTPASLCDDVGVVGGARIRAYQLDYDDAGVCEASVCARGLVGRSCSSDAECVAGATRLQRVTQIGDDAVTTLPELDFTYTELPAISTSSWRGLLSFPSSLVGSPDVAFVDVDADALPDLIQSPQNTTTSYTRWRNLGPAANGTVSFETPGPIGSPPQRLSTPGTTLLDATGDGITDLVYQRSAADGDFGIRPGNGRGFFGAEETLSIAGLSGFSPLGLEDPSLRTTDLDFDKRIDVLRTVTNGSGVPTSIRARFSIEFGGVRALGAEVTCAPIPGVDFASPKTFLVDMNGDRLLDVVVVDTSATQVDSIEYYPGVGRGGFGVNGSCATQGSSITLAGDPVLGLLGADFDGFEGFLFTDLTNDGLADLLWTGRTSLVLWVNAGGDRLRRVDLPGWTPGTDYDRCAPGCNPATADVLELADMNGNGTTDIVHVDRETNGTRYLDLVESTGVPPHLLRTIDNGLGALTTIEYEPSTIDYLEAQSANPWITKPPFPVTVVARKRVRFGLDLDDVVGEDEYATDYRYRDGYYDGVEKEFRGFSEVEKIERGDATQPTLLTRHSFHTGAPDGVDNDGDGLVDERSSAGGAEEEPLKGVLLEQRRETCVDGPDGACSSVGEVFDHSFSRWEVRTLHGATGLVCSGNAAVGCCSDADCSGPGLGGSCVAGGSAEPAILSIDTCESGKSVHWAVSTASRSALIEKGSGPRVDVVSTMDFDPFGNQIESREWGIVDLPAPPGFGCQLTSGVCQGLPTQLCGAAAECGAFGPCVKNSVADGIACGAGDPFAFTNPVEPADERITSSTFAQNTTDWQLRCLVEKTVADAAMNVESRMRHRFDDLPLGECTVGDMTLQEEELIEEARFIPRARTTYDAFGNPIETLDARSSRRTYAYDAAFETFATSEEAFLDGYSLSMGAAYHEGFGLVTRANTWATTGIGPPYSFEYDTHARLVADIKPGDSSAFPTASYDYQLNPAGDGVSFIRIEKREEAAGGTITSFAYTDALGRSLATVEEGSVPDEWVVTNATTFGRRQASSSVFHPYFSGSSGLPVLDLQRNRREIDRDAIGREVEARHPDGNATRIAFLPLSQDRMDENDVAGLTPAATTSVENDGLGRLIRVTERDGSGSLVTHYRYDARDNLLEIEDAHGNRTSAAYDALSRRTFHDDVNRGRTSFRYDDVDNLIEIEDARGQVSVMSYDAMNRVIAENYLDTTGDPTSDPTSDPIDVEYEYDLPVPGGLPLPDGGSDASTFTAGQLARVRDLSGESLFAYDDRRRLRRQLKRVRREDLGPGVFQDFSFGFEYDSLNRRTVIEYPDGDRIEEFYDPRGLVRRVAAEPAGRTVVADASYRPSGQFDEVTLGSGVVARYDYDSRLRLIESRLSGAVLTIGLDLLHYRYELDPVSNVIGIEDLRVDAVPGTPRHNTQRFAYDELHRLTRYELGSSDDPATVFGFLDFTYDQLDNILSRTGDVSHPAFVEPLDSLGTYSYGGSAGRFGRDGRAPGDQPGPGAVTLVGDGGAPIAYAYDASGNLTSYEATALEWDFKDRLVRIETPEYVARYVYDHGDTRILKVVTAKVEWQGLLPGETRRTLYPDPLFEIRDGGQPTKYIMMGEQRVATVTGTLDPSRERVQWVELREGWNAVGLAVDAPDAAAQLELTSAGGSRSGYQPMDPEGYEALGPSSSIGAGTSIWIDADAPALVDVVGAYPAPTASAPSSSGLFSVPGLSAVASDAAAGDAVWLFDGRTSTWRPRILALDILNAWPEMIRPGQVAFAHDTGALIQPTEPAAEIRYHHPDHLGSTTMLTDDLGRVVEESVYFPFGEPRARLPGFDAGLPTTNHLFSDQERDRESGLYYLESRFYLPQLGRFASVDDLVRGMSAIDEPRKLNGYSYALNNPVVMVDPTGREPVPVEWQRVKWYQETWEAYNDLVDNAIVQWVTMEGPQITAFETRTRARSFDTAMEKGIVEKFLGDVIGEVTDTARDDTIEHLLGGGDRATLFVERLSAALFAVETLNVVRDYTGEARFGRLRADQIKKLKQRLVLEGMARAAHRASWKDKPAWYRNCAQQWGGCKTEAGTLRYLRAMNQLYLKGVNKWHDWQRRNSPEYRRRYKSYPQVQCPGFGQSRC